MSTTDTPPPPGEAAGVGRKMAKGAAWTVFMRLSIRMIGLISTVILARLLVPEDFGLVFIATAIVGLLDVLSEFGFEVFLIQAKNPSREHYDSAWTLSVIRGVTIGALLFLLAPQAAAFFEDARLEQILRYLALGSVLLGFQNIGIVEFRKELRFHQDFAFMVSVKLIGFVVTICLALILRSYWALVLGMIAAHAANTLLSYLMHPYRPRLSVSRIGEIFHFSKWLLANSVLTFVNSRSDRFIIGKLVGATAVGLYAVAHEISNLATSELVAPIRRAILPGYAKMARDPATLREGFLDVLDLTLLLSMPIAAGIGVTADLIVKLLLGPKWLPAIPLIQVLTLYGLIRIAAANSGPVYIALGRPHLTTAVMAISVTVTVPAIIIGAFYWGAMGAAWGAVFGAIILMLANFRLALRVLALRLSTLMQRLWRPMFSTAIMAGVVLVLRLGLEEPRSLLASAAHLLTAVGAGAIVYLFSSFAVWRLAGAPETGEMKVLRLLGEHFSWIPATELSGGRLRSSR